MPSRAMPSSGCSTRPRRIYGHSGTATPLSSSPSCAPLWPKPGRTTRGRSAASVPSVDAIAVTASAGNAKSNESVSSSTRGGGGPSRATSGEPSGKPSRKRATRSESDVAGCLLWAHGVHVLREARGPRSWPKRSAPPVRWSFAVAWRRSAATSGSGSGAGGLQPSARHWSRQRSGGPGDGVTDRSYRFRSDWRRRVRRIVLARQGGTCAWQGCAWAGTDGRGKGMHLAHVTPAPYGANDETNVVGLCPSHHRQWDALRAGRSREFGVFGNAPAARQAADLGKQAPHRERPLPPVLALSHGPKRTNVAPVQNGNSTSRLGLNGVGPGSPLFGANNAGIFGDCGTGYE